MKKHYVFSVAALMLCLAVAIQLIIPLSYGGADPLERISRFDDGGNCGKTLLDSAAVAISNKSAVFDISLNGTDGIFIYTTDTSKNQIEAFWQLGTGHNATASYILIKNGVCYYFGMDSEGWFFENSRVCLTDFGRLFKNLARIMADKKVDTAELATDINGLFGTDLSAYFDFAVVPTALRSVVSCFADESFRVVSGYEFERKGFTLKYSFFPENSRALAEKINSVLGVAYTETTRSIANIAGIAGGFAELLGFHMFDYMFDADVSFETDFFSGKLLSFTYETENTVFSAVNKKYGGSKINIDSAQLEALLIKHVV